MFYEDNMLENRPCETFQNLIKDRNYKVKK